MLAPPTRPAPDPATAGPAFPDPDGVLPGLGDYLPGKGAMPGQHILPAVHPSTAPEQAPAPDAARKIIIFTEHRDTLEYLAERIRDLLGRSDAVVTIHGGVRREERRRVTELFTQDIDTRVLVATDAAGEGLNLQRAHLMVNYDLPWNPNRIEQRFGRIHRIGQTEVCHLWNLVADGTREGMVFLQLLTKIEEQRKAYHGKVFDVLGEAFQGQPLKDLLVEAIRYGNRPEVRAQAARGHRQDRRRGPGQAHRRTGRALRHLRHRRPGEVARPDGRGEPPPPPAALHQRLLPRSVQAARRPAVRTRVRTLRDPPRPRRHPRPRPPGRHRPAPVLPKYERVTFDKNLTRPEGKPKADLLAPGHPLLDAVTDLIIERYGTLLKQGTMLADRHDPGTEPRLLVAVTHEITDGHDPARTITKKFGFVGGRRNSGVRSAGEARYLDYEPMNDSERMVASPLRDAPWLASGVENVALDWAVTEGMPEELARTRDLVTARVAQVRRLVKQRLTGEINYWDMRYAELLDAAVRGPVTEDETGDRLGPRPRPGTPPGEAPRGPGPGRGTDRPPAGHLRGRAGRAAGPAQPAARRPGAARPSAFARDTTETDRRAIAAVLAAERALGRDPTRDAA